MKDKPFYVESTYGAGIRWAKTLEKAEKDFLNEVGSYGYKSVRPATEQDIAWVKSMGGDTEP